MFARQRRRSMSAIRRIAASPHLAVLAGLVLLGAVLRFATLDLQSYRYDEAVTVGRVLQPSLFDTLSAVAHSESTPPLYYLVAWLWSRPFGTGEVWMRSLSALAGTGSIVVVYLGAVALPLPRRAGLIAAAMVAVSPVLIWFSQDARAYALVFLLTALSFLFFARARRSGARRDLAWWAVFSALAFATHYFAGFVVAPEAVAAAARAQPAAARSSPCSPRRRGGRAAGADRAAPGRTRPRRLDRRTAARPTPRTRRGEAGRQRQRRRARRPPAGPDPARGPGRPRPRGAGAPALARRPRRAPRRPARGDRRRGAVALPLLLGLFGSDYFDGRNLLPAFVPLIVLLGAGFGVRRAGRAGLALAARLLPLLARLHPGDRPAAAPAARGPAQRRGPGRPAAAGQRGGDDPLRRQPAAALLPRRQVRHRPAAAAARDRPGRLPAGRRRQRPPPAPSRLPPRSGRSRSPTTSP